MRDLRETAQVIKRHGLRNAETFKAAQVADHYLSVLDELEEARQVLRDLVVDTCQCDLRGHTRTCQRARKFLKRAENG